MKDFFELRENKIFFVKVGDGRDSMTVKVKADTKGAAIKKLKDKYPKYPVSLDRNQKQGKPAGALESVELDESVKVGDKTEYQGSPAEITHVDKKRQAVKAKVLSGKHKGQIVSFGFDELDESVKTEDKGQFIYAAKQAKAKGDSTFVFAGKTYNCEEVLENEDLDESVNMGPWNRGAINKAMSKAGIKGPMAKAFIAALRNPEK